MTLTEASAPADADDAGEELADVPPGLLGQLRPYLPDRRAAVVLCSGSVVLSRLIWSWVTAGDWRTARNRLAGGGVGVYVAWYLETHHMPFVAPVAAAAWCAAALYLSPKADADGGQDDDADDEFGDELADDDEPGGAPVPAPLPRRVDLGIVVRLAHELAAADDTPNSRAVQLDHLLAHLAGLPKTALAAALQDAGVPIREVKYRLPGGRQQVRQGVRLEDFPAGLGEALQPAPAGLHSAPAPAAAEGAAHSLSKPSPPPLPAPLPEAG